MADRKQRWFGMLNGSTLRAPETKPFTQTARAFLTDGGPERPAGDEATERRSGAPPLAADPPQVEDASPPPLAAAPSAEVASPAPPAAPLRSQEALPAPGFEEAPAEFVTEESSVELWSPAAQQLHEIPSLDGEWIAAKPLREQSLLRLMLTHDAIRSALSDGPVVEVRASADGRLDCLVPFAAAMEVNANDSKEAQRAIRSLKNDISMLFLHNALQYLTETRQFLGLCFSKLAIGGVLVISVPHQFLYERKLRLPSRRNRFHRRFYTSNVLLADVEEAIDPSEFRVRFLGESDAGYPYREGLGGSPGGGQDILLAVEKIAAAAVARRDSTTTKSGRGTPTKPVRAFCRSTARRRRRSRSSRPIRWRRSASSW